MEIVCAIHANGAVLESTLSTGALRRALDSPHVLTAFHGTTSGNQGMRVFSPPGFVTPLGDAFLLHSHTHSTRLELWSPHDNNGQLVAKRKSEAQQMAKQMTAFTSFPSGAKSATTNERNENENENIFSFQNDNSAVARALATGVTSVASGGREGARYVLRGTNNGALVITALSYNTVGSGSGAGLGLGSGSGSGLGLGSGSGSSSSSSSSSSRTAPHSAQWAVHLHNGPITAISTNAKGWVATGGMDCNIVVFPLSLALSLSPQLRSLDSLRIVLSGHTLPITQVHLTAQKRMYSIGKDHSLKLWDIPSRTLLATVSFPSVPTCCALSPLEDRIYVGTQEGTLHVVHTWALTAPHSSDQPSEQTQTAADVLTARTAVTALAVNLDGTRVVSGHQDGSTVVWDASTTHVQKLFHLLHHKAPVSYISIRLRGNEEQSENVNVPSLNSAFTSLPSERITSPTTLVSTFITGAQHTADESGKEREEEMNQKIFSSIDVRYSPSSFTALSFLYSSSSEPTYLSTQSGKGGAGNDALEIERLKQEILRLQEANERWKRLNNKLYSVALQTQPQPK